MEEKILDAIAGMSDPKRLRNFVANAKKEGAHRLAEAAFRRLAEVLPEEAPGTLEHDFWRSIFAFEETLREERGRTVRLSRTRQKVARVGVVQTLIDFATSSAPSDGFTMLIDRNLPELTGEAVILRHSGAFPAHVVSSAKERLERAAASGAPESI